MPDSPRVFDEILSERALHPLIIFDLDSTIFNVTHRSQAILELFARDEEVTKLFPSEVERVKEIRLTPRDWGIKEAFIREKFQATEDFFATVRDFWRSRFFSSDFLHNDIPYEGAVEYVQALAAAGLHIMYLTGRDDVNMRRGTLASLQQWGLPLADAEHDLIMKPAKGSVEDNIFKLKELQRLYNEPPQVSTTPQPSPAQNSLSHGAPPRIWFFENEPLIIHTVRDEMPHVQIVWIDTTHSRRAEPPSGLHVIRDVWRRSR